jgi:hypothetical protein
MLFLGMVHKTIKDPFGERSANNMPFDHPFMQRHLMKHRLLIATLGAAMALHPLAAAPLKVYLMAGQSNMQGFCAVHTFPQIEADPVTRPIYEKW